MVQWTKTCMFVVLLGCQVWAASNETSELFDPRITDITVFKDGHALILAKDQADIVDGWCRTQDVPVPVLGTFWTYVDQADAQVDYVKAGFVDSRQQRPCLTFDEMIQANQGKKVIITENSKTTHCGKIAGILKHEKDSDTEPSTQLASFIMLQTDQGLELIQRSHVRGITLIDEDPATSYSEDKKVREIAIHVNGLENSDNDKVEVGMVYLQKGFRWIPDYRIELLADGKAKITLQATLINEIADLENTNLRLVVGVPSFLMKETLSPMALREIGLKLSSYFATPRPDSSGRIDYLSNAIMSQRIAETRISTSTPPETTIPVDGQTEDLYVYHKTGINLKKGERAVVMLYEAVIPYTDIYTWDIPPVPPRELWNHIDNRQQQQLVNALKGARAMHELRMKNDSEVPWTTGPAMIFKDGLPLGQQMVTYTSIGNTLDLPVTIATDLNIKKTETEIERNLNVNINGISYTQIFIKGTLSITNFKDQAVRAFINRNVIGQVTTASDSGKITQKSVMDDTTVSDGPYPWYGWNWPRWWYHVNAIAEVAWELEIPAGQTVSVEYEYDYYYRH